MSDPLAPVAVNFHLYRPCNLRCRFCYASFRDVKGRLSTPDAMRIIDALRDAGTSKLNFVGGEPTLHPDIGPLLAHAKRIGLVTSMVSNGARLRPLLDRQAGDLDWVGLSVDSGDEAVQAELGRGRGDHVAGSIALTDHARVLGVRIKLNTVVTALGWQEDMSPLVRRIRPERWKAFQVLPMDGQTDERILPLLIDAERFRAFVDRHAHLAAEGLAPVPEDNDAMRGSYVMIDPLGRFFGNATGRHVYSAPILDVGVRAGLAQVAFSPEKFAARGGVYAW